MTGGIPLSASCWHVLGLIHKRSMQEGAHRAPAAAPLEVVTVACAVKLPARRLQLEDEALVATLAVERAVLRPAVGCVAAQHGATRGGHEAHRRPAALEALEETVEGGPVPRRLKHERPLPLKGSLDLRRDQPRPRALHSWLRDAHGACARTKRSRAPSDQTQSANRIQRMAGSRRNAHRQYHSAPIALFEALRGELGARQHSAELLCAGQHVLQQLLQRAIVPQQLS